MLALLLDLLLLSRGVGDAAGARYVQIHCTHIGECVYMQNYRNALVAVVAVLAVGSNLVTLLLTFAGCVRPWLSPVQVEHDRPNEEKREQNMTTAMNAMLRRQQELRGQT